jgi:molecular chaperone IbpA
MGWYSSFIKTGSFCIFEHSVLELWELTLPKGATTNQDASLLKRSNKMTLENIMYKHFLGFDERFFNPVDDTAYPRHNIVTRGDDYFRIEMALPGWMKENIEVSLDKRTLTIQGMDKLTCGDEEEYLHKGISGKMFKRTFSLGEFIEIQGVQFENGLLSIELEKVIPEDKKPKVFDIK